MDTLNASVLIVAPRSAVVATQLKEVLDDLQQAYTYTSDWSKASKLLDTERPCVVIVDAEVDEPKLVDFCKYVKKIRTQRWHELILLIDNHKDFELQWNFMKSGVDEFFVRDANINLLAERIKCIIQRHLTVFHKIPQQGLFIDRETYSVYKDGETIRLPRKQFELLSLLASKPGKVFTRQDIFQMIWGHSTFVGDRTIDVHIRKIRETIGDEHIGTIKGIGYKFNA